MNSIKTFEDFMNYMNGQTGGAEAPERKTPLQEAQELIEAHQKRYRRPVPKALDKTKVGAGDGMKRKFIASLREGEQAQPGELTPEDNMKNKRKNRYQRQ